MRPSEDCESSASNSFGALASIHLRAVVRNTASCGVSSKFIWRILSPVIPGRCDSIEPGISFPNLWIPGSRFACPGMTGPLASSLRWYLVERHVLVDPDIAGQAKHALGDDVAHDLVRAALDAGTGRAQQHRLEFSGK